MTSPKATAGSDKTSTPDPTPGAPTGGTFQPSLIAKRSVQWAVENGIRAPMESQVEVDENPPGEETQPSTTNTDDEPTDTQEKESPEKTTTGAKSKDCEMR